VGAVIVQEQYLAGDNHRARAQLTTRLVVPGLVLQPPDHPHALARAHVLIDDLGQPPPGRDAVPVGLLLALAVLALPDAVGGHAEVGDRRAIGGVAHLGHCAHVADELDAIDRVVGCHSLCLLVWPLVGGVEVVDGARTAGANEAGA
jgi:hypothetical protein